VVAVNRHPRSLAGFACLAFALVGAACTASGGSAPGSVAGRPVIVVGSFDFPESVTLAYLYGDALVGATALSHGAKRPGLRQQPAASSAIPAREYA
jgi:hypothetical protein